MTITPQMMEAKHIAMTAIVENVKSEVANVQRDNHRLRLALVEAKLAIEYLHEKFQPTGSTNTALVRIEEALAE